MSLYVYVPTLTIYTQGKVADLEQVGVVLSMYGLWQAIVRLPLGILADWLGRRKVFILLGFLLSGLGAWLMSSAGGYTGLVTGRAITGLAAAGWVPLTVLFSGLFAPQDAVRAAGILSLINGASRMLATSITGSLNDLGGYSLAFYAAVGLAGLALLVTLPVSETPRPPKTPAVRAIFRLITRRDVLLPALLSAVAQYITWASTFGFLPILARDLGASGQIVSLLVSVYMAVSVGSNLLLTRLVRRLGNRTLLLIGIGINTAGVACAALAGSLGMLVLAQVLLGLGYGISYPLCMGMSIEQVADSERSTAMGLHQAVYAIGMFAGPWLSGILAERYGIRPMFAVTAAGCLGISLLLVRFLERPAAVAASLAER
jgi:MFS family permease